MPSSRNDVYTPPMHLLRAQDIPPTIHQFMRGAGLDDPASMLRFCVVAYCGAGAVWPSGCFSGSGSATFPFASVGCPSPVWLSVAGMLSFSSPSFAQPGVLAYSGFFPVVPSSAPVALSKNFQLTWSFITQLTTSSTLTYASKL